MSVHYSSPTRPRLRLCHAQRIDYHTGVLKEDSAAAKSSTTSVHDSLQLRVLDTDWCARDELQPAEFFLPLAPTRPGQDGRHACARVQLLLRVLCLALARLSEFCQPRVTKMTTERFGPFQGHDPALHDNHG